MSNTNPVTLQAAILSQIREFATTGKTFSVHEVTQALRSKVNSGTLEIPEVETQNASFRFDIPHKKVKSIFEDLWNSGVFTPDFTLNRRFTGVYFEYIPVTATTSTPTPPVAPIGTVAVPAASPATIGVATVSGKVPKSTVMSRISQYLDNCASRSFRPTLKQVQSAIKRGDVSTGWNCEEIKDVVEQELGYSLSVNPDLISKSQIIL